MLQSLTKFFNKVRGRKTPCNPHTCCNGCKEVLHLVIDGEATEDQVKYLHDHIEDCSPCFDHYEIDKSVKEVLQHKLEHKPVPNDLVSSIREKLSKEA